MQTIKFDDGKEFSAISVYGGVRHFRGSARESLAIEIKDSSYEMINSYFKDNVHFILLESDMGIDPETGEEIEIINTYDKETYTIAGDIIDYRNGIFVVYMGEKTEVELLREELEHLKG